MSEGLASSPTSRGHGGRLMHDFARIALGHAEANPQATAFRFLRFSGSEDDLVTYQSLASKFAGIGRVISAEIPVGARAVLLYEPGAEFIYALLACFWSHIIAVPMAPPCGGRQYDNVMHLRRVIVNSGAKFILTTKALAARVQGMLEIANDQARILATDLMEPSGAPGPSRCARSDAALIQYSSGSSGEPRGVLISHKNLLSNSEAIRQAFRHHRECIGVSWLPHFHDMGLVGGILQPLYVGFEVVLMAPDDFIQQPLRWLGAISNFHATTSGAPTFGYRHCCRRIRPDDLNHIRLDKWRVAFCGSEPINAELLRSFEKQFSSVGFSGNAFVPCYGLAEATLLVTSKFALESRTNQSTPADTVDQVQSKNIEEVINSKDQEGAGIGREIVNCGNPAKNTSIAITSPDSDRIVGPGVIGEICVSGPGIGICYWRNSDASRAAFSKKLHKQVHGRYLRTGDLGFMIDGSLHVTGRLKDTIKISGKTTHAIDIETEMESCNPCLQNGAGAAVARQTESGEELILVQEVPRPSEAKDLNSLARKIFSRVVEKFGLRPRMVVLVRTPAIPRTTSGKVIRALCKHPQECFKSNQILELFSPQMHS